METTTIIEAARTEQRALEKQIHALDAEYAAYQGRKKALALRLEAVKSLRAAYGDSAMIAGLEVVARGIAELGGAILKAQVVRENSHKARVLAAASELLADGVHLPTRELLEKIEQRGIQFNAANKAGNLSVILSKDKKFVSDRRSGWSLKKENPQDATTSAGLLAAYAASQLTAPEGPTRTE